MSSYILWMSISFRLAVRIELAHNSSTICKIDYPRARNGQTFTVAYSSGEIEVESS